MHRRREVPRDDEDDTLQGVLMTVTFQKPMILNKNTITNANFDELKSLSFW